MNRNFILLFCFFIMINPAFGQEVQDFSTEKSEPDRILVVGQRPGPGLWKISNGGHVLWILGTYSPLPKNLEWRSQEVELILANSQEYIQPPAAKIDFGFFRSITLLPHAIGFKKNPDGAKLKDVLPADVYERWLPLKKKYIGDDTGIERQRPIFVADELYRKALGQAGLSSGREIRSLVEKIIKEKNINIVSSDVKLTIDSPAQIIRDFKKSSLDDAECFSLTLSRLETDIDSMRMRANAWSKGDIGGIEKLGYADQQNPCKAAVSGSPALKDEPSFQSVELRMRDTWVANAEKALASNSSTFSLLPMRDLLDSKGPLAVLQSKGYSVEKPD